MIRASVYYNNGPETRFDHDYYENQHRELVLARLGPMGLVRMEAERGLGGLGGAPAPFVGGGHLYFETMEALQAALGAHLDEPVGDIPNFTNVEPVVQISEISRE